MQGVDVNGDGRLLRVVDGRPQTIRKTCEDSLCRLQTLPLAISHELRSPLTRARLNTELLRDLLESERLASRHAALQREATDLW